MIREGIAMTHKRTIVDLIGNTPLRAIELLVE